MVRRYLLFSALAACVIFTSSAAAQQGSTPANRAALSGETARIIGQIEAQARGSVLLVDCHGAFGYSTIQAAIDMAAEGDIVVVLPRNAFGFACNGDAYVENINFLGKAITVQSLIPTSPDYVECTIIDGSGASVDDLEGSVVTFNHGEDAESVLDGLTLTKGTGWLNMDNCAMFARDGGGIYVSSSNPTIRKCVITANTIDGDGGGICCTDNSNPLISNCTISNNVLTTFGGGISCNQSSPTISNCLLTGNSAIEGGAVYCYGGQAVIRNCTLVGNTAAAGGGLWCQAGSPVMYNCTLADNVAGDGGGIFLYNAGTATIRNCMIANNTVTGNGGALNLMDAGAVITNCTITANSAGSCGGAFSTVAASPTSLTNCILWNNTAGQNGPELYLIASAVSVAYSDVAGGLGGVFGNPPAWLAGNIDVDPLFVRTHLGDHRLGVESPCYNGGDPLFVPEDGEMDIDDDPRVGFGRVDMGADEYAGPADCNDNGIPDETDIANGTSGDCTGDGIPDECEVDCNMNGAADSCDIAADTSQDCNNNSIPDECEWVDCNNNNVLDECDVDYGTSDDCNDNHYPDECEVGGEEDCNANANPDLCDLFDGTSSDENNNHVPDECESNRTIHVDADGGPGPGTGSETDPFHRIQDAIDSAMSGDVIVVADGVYTGVGNKNLNFWGRLITVRSVSGAANCVIDCQGCGRGFYFHSDETSAARVQGFTITNGGGIGSGGGVFCVASSPTISRCAIVGNNAEYGGGIASVVGGSPMMDTCLIGGNTASSKGGGFYGADGRPILGNCTMVGNSAGYGGGIYGFRLNMAVMDNGILSDNEATDEGLGIYLNRSSLVVAYSDVEGGVAALYVDDDSELVWEEGNIDADPVFVDPAGGNFRLSACSACIDEGDPGFVPEAGATDLDGHARELCGRVDMGAYEFGAGDVDCDHDVDLNDLAIWEFCMTGPSGGGYLEGCKALDLEYDGDVDLADFAGFQRLFTGMRR